MIMAKFKENKVIVKHEIPPFFDASSQILILGSLPSVESRRQAFYYAHPKNRFWQVLSLVFACEINDKKAFLKQKHIALWDVIASCTINKSSDASIKDVVVNDLKVILNIAPIKAIFVLGSVAYKYYQKYYPDLNIPVYHLPSTSPANAKLSLEDLKVKYMIIKEELEK